MSETTQQDMPRINARWTDDCQGKKDFDGTIIDISSRYWPRGGGFGLFSRVELIGGPFDGQTRDVSEDLPGIMVILLVNPNDPSDDRVQTGAYEPNSWQQGAFHWQGWNE